MIKSVIDFLTAFMFNILGMFGALLNDKLQLKLGILLGVIFKVITPKRRIVTEQNLKLAFPEADDKRIKNLVNESFKNIGITAVEISSMKFMTDNRICKKVIKIENEDIFNDAIASEKPIMIITSHFNNWELFGFFTSKAKNIIMNLITKKQSNSIIDKEINKIRTRAGNKTIDMGNAARKLIPVFQSGGCVAMIVDQSARGDKGVLYPTFFNIPTATYASAAYLTLKFDANMLFIILIRQSSGKYILRCEKIVTEDLICNDQGVEVLTQRHVDALESVIRQYPEQWVWQHKRWKRMPKGNKNVY